MPTLRDLNVFRHLPIPTTRNYTLLSALILALAGLHARSLSGVDDWRVNFEQQILNESDRLGEPAAQWLANSVAFQILYYMLTDQLYVWVLVNALCCAAVAFGSLCRALVVGHMRVAENQQLRDRLWSFVFQKFIFVFGVLNQPFLEETILWALWFVAVGLFHHLTMLALDRYKFLASSSSRAFNATRWRVMALMVFSLVNELLLLLVALAVSVKVGANYGGFLLADALILALRSCFCLFRYGVNVRGLDESSERRQRLVYSGDLLFELSILFAEFVHHIHMLIWSNIFLSMASLVICMQLRHIYYEIDARLKRHRNFRRIVEHMDQHFPMATPAELDLLEDQCAICWDEMASARKLPCGHFFHKYSAASPSPASPSPLSWCLRGWLEQDSSCPTCRLTLSVGAQPAGRRRDAAAQQQDALLRRARAFSHFFHFDGRRYARWLPSFSVEVSTTNAFFGRRPNALRPEANSQLNAMAEQVREMFPQVPAETILDDLRRTLSVEATIENLIDGSFGISEDSFSADGSASNSDVESSRDDSSLAASSPSSSTAAAAAAASVGRPAPAVASPLGSRFSKDACEREHLLDETKRSLIRHHRRAYLESPRGADLRERFAFERDSH